MIRHLIFIKPWIFNIPNQIRFQNFPNHRPSNCQLQADSAMFYLIDPRRRLIMLPTEFTEEL